MIGNDRVFDILEKLGQRFPDLRGYYARGTGGFDAVGILEKLDDLGLFADHALIEEFRRDWPLFCDADPVAPDFSDRMETAGLIELRWIDEGEAQATVDADPFWTEKYGDEMPSSIYVLTEAGRAALTPSTGADAPKES